MRHRLPAPPAGSERASRRARSAQAMYAWASLAPRWLAELLGHRPAAPPLPRQPTPPGPEPARARWARRSTRHGPESKMSRPRPSAAPISDSAPTLAISSASCSQRPGGRGFDGGWFIYLSVVHGQRSVAQAMSQYLSNSRIQCLNGRSCSPSAERSYLLSVVDFFALRAKNQPQ